MGLGDLKAKIDSAMGKPLSFTKLEGSGLQLTKAELVPRKDAAPDGAEDKEIEGGPDGEKKKGSIKFFLNPSAIKISRSVNFGETKKAEGGDVGPTKTEVKAGKSQPITLTISNAIFDTYETRTSVRQEYIDALEDLTEWRSSTHHPPAVSFVWGGFNKSRYDKTYLFYVTSMEVNYTMFLPDGTPVRAEVTLSLQQVWTEEMETEKAPQSPDHAKLYTVRRGDTLQAIAQQEYNDPREWRRIADTNGLDDPMRLKPGTKLLVPPILV